MIYKNQIKPLFYSKIEKHPGKKSFSNTKKYSYGGNKLRIATNTNNHSYKEKCIVCIVALYLSYKNKKKKKKKY